VRCGGTLRVVAGTELASGYPLIEAVGRGSVRPPRLLDLRFARPGAPRVTLVGKGVCFDSGGLDIKPSSGMLLMKKDMGGAACALGLALALREMDAPVELRVLVPAVENSVDGASFRPGDVWPSRKGLRVEIGNTDAEGRLVLADALAEAGEEAPALPDVTDSPGAFRSSLPIFVPILLIVLNSIAQFPTKPLGTGVVLEALAFIGQPVVALLLGVGIALFLPKKLERAMLSDKGWVGQGIMDAAGIIIITGAGGAFGKVLQNSGITKVVGDALATSNLGILLPFVIAAGIKTAQGSSTVSIITTAGLMAPLLPALGLDGATATALTVVAIGAGAMVVSHANDSFFWVVTQFSNMSPEIGYRLHTVGTLAQGLVAIAVLWVITAIVL
jgi:GntP family gluconate:H+ symporter